MRDGQGGAPCADDSGRHGWQHRWRGRLRTPAPGRRAQRRDVPRARRRGSAPWSGSTASAAGRAGPRRRTSTRPCSSWCAGCCPCRRCSTSGARTPRPVPPGLLVTSYLPGERLDLLLPELDEPARAAVGRSVGVVLARLAMMPMPRPGLFVDGDLRVDPLPAGDLVDFVEARRPGVCPRAVVRGGVRRAGAGRGPRPGPAGRRTTHLPGAQRPEPQEPAGRPATRSRSPGSWTGSSRTPGMPVTDLGNLLRFDRDPAFVGGRAGDVLRARAGRAGRRCWTWPARPTCTHSWTSPPGARENPVAERAHAPARRDRRERGPARRADLTRCARLDSGVVPLRILWGAPEVCRSLRRSRFSLAISRWSHPTVGGHTTHW